MAIFRYFRRRHLKYLFLCIILLGTGTYLHIGYWFVFAYMPSSLPKDNCSFLLPLINTLHQQRDNANGGIIHQSWKSSHLPERFLHWSASWRGCFPNWKYHLWTDRENRCLIQEFYSWFLPTYDSYPYNIHRVDAVRYFYLHQFGGLYTDMDNECLRPFGHLLHHKGVVFAAMNGIHPIMSQAPEGWIQNSFMFSQRPNHPFWRTIFHHLLKRSLGLVEMVTGPVLLMLAIQEYRQEHPQNDLTVFPGRYFNPFSWLESDVEQRVIDCKSLNSMTDLEIHRCRQHFQNSSYVLQYHVQSWKDGKEM